jgi:hypothetical protein
MVYQEDSEITAVAFVAPKREVFTSSVRQLLIISTTRHIKIVGVSANDDKFTLIDMEMSTNATGVKIQKIHGTSQGRVFMIGDDCNLWELDYRVRK